MMSKLELVANLIQEILTLGRGAMKKGLRTDMIFVDEGLKIAQWGTAQGCTQHFQSLMRLKATATGNKHADPHKVLPKLLPIIEDIAAVIFRPLCLGPNADGAVPCTAFRISGGSYAV